MYPGSHVATQPDKPAVIMGTGETITYRELDDRSAQLAQLLHARGLRPGDKIALLAENHPRYFEVFWAAVRSGLYLTAVNRHLGTDEAAYVVNDCGATVFIASAALADTAAAVAEVTPNVSSRLMMDGVVPGFESYEAAIASQPAEALAEQPRGHVMLYSSGTTGLPKGVMRELTGVPVEDAALVGAANLEKTWLGMDASSIYLCPAPLYHAAGLQWSAGVHELGGTVVVMERFQEEEWLRLIERERVTHTQVVPTMLVRVMKLPAAVRLGYDVSSLHCVVHAAAPCPVEVKRQVIDWLGPIVSEFYAGTETNGMTFLTASEWLEHPGSVGRAVVGIPHVCAPDGQELPPGEEGDLYFEKNEKLFEYHNDPEKTKKSRHPDHPNWSTLGDVGYLDEDGYLYLTDRRNFTIISGGVNIYPAEIESCLVMHPAVADVAVFGLPDPDMGEYVHAVVQVADGTDGTPELAEELRTYTRSLLAGYKVPKVIDFRDDLPRLPTGKLAKRKLRDEYQGIRA